MSFDPAVSRQAAANVFTFTRPSWPPQAYSAGEREVARAGRIMRQIIKEKSLAEQEADRQAADSKKRAWGLPSPSSPPRSTQLRTPSPTRGCAPSWRL